jgi:hypothetical protein
MTQISELDAQTGILEIRDATPEELESLAEAQTVDFEAVLAEQQALKASAVAKLAVLGLTEDEAKLLLA